MRKNGFAGCTKSRVEMGAGAENPRLGWVGNRFSVYVSVGLKNSLGVGWGIVFGFFFLYVMNICLTDIKNGLIKSIKSKCEKLQKLV